MSLWFLEFLDRVALERNAFQELEEFPWFCGHVWKFRKNRLCVEVEIEARGQRHCLLLEYPPLFPNSVPTVTPNGEPRRLSEHQYGPGGELCLEWGPDNWVPSITGSELVESAVRLIEGTVAVAGEEVPVVADRHSTTLGQDLRNCRRFVLGPEAERRLSTLADAACPVPAQFRGFLEGDSLSVHLEMLNPNDEATCWANTDVPLEVLKEGWIFTGFILPTLGGLPRQGPISDVDMGDRLQQDGYLETLNDRPGHISLLWVHGTEGAVLVQAAGEAGADFHVAHTVRYERPDATQRTPGAYQGLEGRKVAIVGLGSAGSHIALSLVRTGLRKFLLVDDDVLLPENLIRHELDWRSVGAHKVSATAAAMKRIAAEVAIQVQTYALDSQRATANAAGLDAAIGECDLVINATASPHGFNRLAGVVAQSRTPVVWMEVFGGGFGGMIARSRPGIDPDPFTMRLQIGEWAGQQTEPVPEVLGHYEARAEDGTPWIATDADVRAIAAHTTGLALDALRTDTEDSDYPSNVYFIGLRRGWIFDQPFDVRPLNLARRPDGPAKVEPQLEKETVGFLAGLLETYESDPSSE